MNTAGEHSIWQARGRNAGFTLVELLVSLVILSIGLLGVAKMSLGTVQSNDSALMRSQATALIQQIVDNMRANQPQAVATGYDIAYGVTPSSSPNCYAGGCDASDVADYDLTNWKALLQANLPDGDGQIVTSSEVDPSTGGSETTATISVQWNDSVAQQSFGAAVSPMTITVETLL